MPKFLVRDYTPWIQIGFDLDRELGFQFQEMAEQRRQVEQSFKDNLVGKLGAGYIKVSPWFAAFERACNNLDMGGRPVGRHNFVDKLLSTIPGINKSLFLDYLENTGDEWHLYSQYHLKKTEMSWSWGDIDIKEILTDAMRKCFDCKEGDIPGYFGKGPRGRQLTADISSNLEHLDRNAARVRLAKLRKHKLQKVADMGPQNYRRWRNELRHRVGRLEYEERLASLSNDQAATDDVQGCCCEREYFCRTCSTRQWAQSTTPRLPRSCF
jgi:hypothetical protein